VRGIEDADGGVVSSGGGVADGEPGGTAQAGDKGAAGDSIAGEVRQRGVPSAGGARLPREHPAVMETIRGIAKKDWGKYEGGAWENRDTEIAETIHCFSEDEDLPAHRLIVLRWLKEQPELLDKDPYEYHAVVTSYDNWTAGLVLQFHRTRQDASENVNKELSGGFGLSKLPCREMMANAAYFQMALLANTVFVAMKHLALPESWKTLTIKTVRFRLIRMAGIVTRRSRYLWLKISQDHPLQKVFEEARWRLLGLSMELAHT